MSCDGSFGCVGTRGKERRDLCSPDGFTSVQVVESPGERGKAEYLHVSGLHECQGTLEQTAPLFSGATLLSPSARTQVSETCLAFIDKNHRTI